jgi:peptidyl-prolyl cis-trans isomerase D
VIDAREAGFIWYEVQGVTPARERTLDEARAAVTAAFVANEKANALREKADALVKELRAGKTLEDAAKSVGAEVKQAWDLRRGQAAQGVSSDAVAAIFSTAVNDFGSANSGTPGERVVFKLTGSSVPAFDPGADTAKAAERQLASQMGQDVLNQYVLRSQDELGLTINQQLLNQAIGAQN